MSPDDEIPPVVVEVRTRAPESKTATALLLLLVVGLYGGLFLAGLR